MSEQQDKNPGLRPIMDFFPMDQPRGKQQKVLDFIERAYNAGYLHVVIAAPTGLGKSACGVAVCEWSKQLPLEGESGGYYVVTQKLLQDQLTKDFNSGKFHGTGATIKSAVEYPCPKYKNCGLGSRATIKCYCRKEQTCTYQAEKAIFLSSSTAITNYSYIFAEHKYAQQLPKRKVIILDECHNLERQLIRFNDVRIGPELIEEWGLDIPDIPELNSLREFIRWIEQVYEPELKLQSETILSLANENNDDQFAKKAVDMDQHLCKLHRAVKLMKTEPSNWVFWSEETKTGKLDYISRPLDASPYRSELVDEMGSLRVYMSAFPGTKKIFCRSLGLDPDEVAWINLRSSFEPKNRPVVMGFAGSMSRRNVDSTMPSFLKLTKTILQSHAQEKGVIHCNSYKLGQQIMEHFRGTPEGKRLLFPQNAKEREKIFDEHSKFAEPTVIVTPSMTEGYDFYGDLASWQIIAKCPYPHLGDAQIAAKKEQDGEWYALQTIMTIIQATGRICRSESDRGITYVLDADFMMLWDRHSEMFPEWYKEAVVWPKKRH